MGFEIPKNHCFSAQQIAINGAKCMEWALRRPSKAFPSHLTNNLKGYVEPDGVSAVENEPSSRTPLGALIEGKVSHCSGFSNHVVVTASPRRPLQLRRREILYF